MDFEALANLETQLEKKARLCNIGVDEWELAHMFRLDEAGRGRAMLQSFGPPAGLEEHVASVDVLRRSEGSGGSSWRVVPDDCGYCLLHLKSSRDGGIAGARLRIVGARSEHEDIDPRGRAATIGVRLRPGAHSRLLGIRGAELLDRGIAAETLLGARARRLVDRVAESRDLGVVTSELVRLVRELAERARPVDPRLAAFDHLTRSGEAASISSLARRLGLPERTLRDVLVRETGLTPKRFVRIRRLHRALDLALSAEMRDGAHLAVAAGYWDQAHCIRDFRDLLGESPRRFVQRGFVR